MNLEAMSVLNQRFSTYVMKCFFSPQPTKINSDFENLAVDAIVAIITMLLPQTLTKYLLVVMNEDSFDLI